jgi:hypothetical protein
MIAARRAYGDLLGRFRSARCFDTVTIKITAIIVRFSVSVELSFDGRFLRDRNSVPHVLMWKKFVAQLST